MKNLIFLISPPRAGSSLTQQIINAHPAVYSLPEPWLLLPLVYLLKKDEDGTNCYDQDYAKISLERFLAATPNIRKSFIEKIKNLALKIYKESMLNEDAIYFLDKTPRYYHIIDDLLEWFPNAKLILLSRNPAAVFCSMMDYNFSGRVDWLQRTDRFHDLCTSFQKMSEFKDHPRVLYLRYEDLVTDTEATTINIFKYLDLEINDKIKNGHYELNVFFNQTDSIDKKSVKRHNKPVSDYVESWKNSIDTYQKKRLLLEYFNSLEEDVINNLGYSFLSIKNDIERLKVPWRPLYIPFKLISHNYGKKLTSRQYLLLVLLQKILKR